MPEILWREKAQPQWTGDVRPPAFSLATSIRTDRSLTLGICSPYGRPVKGV
jgi:hypothetical protein